MKKFVFLFAMLLAFSLTASAQFEFTSKAGKNFSVSSPADRRDPRGGEMFVDYYYTVEDADLVVYEVIVIGGKVDEVRVINVPIDPIDTEYFKARKGLAEIALFKRKDGSYLIAETSVGCGPACDGGVKFSTYQNAKWTDVTKQFAPKITNQAAFKSFRKNGGVSEEIKSGENLPFYYLLPQFGKTLKVACNECSGEADDFVLLEYEWNGEKFVKK